MDRRTWIRSLPAFALLPAVFALAADTDPADRPAIRWHYDLDSAHDVSLQTGKPLLVVFSAEWCNFCRKLDRETFAHPQLVNFVNHGFVPVVLELEQHRQTAEILGVKSVPSSVVLTPNADLVGRLVGYVDASRYYEALKMSRKLQTRLEQ
ncbi:MAG: thioredoxin family protein [Planctomycetes bacterium]|nr:thioredoxin family protein [Planctomycetota bacterium]